MYEVFDSPSSKAGSLLLKPKDDELAEATTNMESSNGKSEARIRCF